MALVLDWRLALFDPSGRVCRAMGEIGARIKVLVGCLPPLLAWGISEALAVDERFDVIARDAPGVALEREVELGAPQVVVVGEQIAYEQLGRMRASEHPPAIVVAADRHIALIGPLLVMSGMSWVSGDAGGDELRDAVYFAATGTDTDFRSEAGQHSELATDQLTTREHEVLECLIRGLTNAQIAQDLHISTATARTHVARIFDKCGLRKRDEYLGIAPTRRNKDRLRIQMATRDS